MSLLSILQSSFIQDRPKLCWALMDGRMNQIETSIIIAAIGSCFIHHRLKLIHELIKSCPLRFSKFTSSDWSELLRNCYILDRSKLLLIILNTLPIESTQQINEKHVRLVYVHARSEMNRKLFDLKNKRIQMNEMKMKQMQEEQERVLKIELQASMLKDETEENKHDMREYESKSQIPTILNPSSIKVCTKSDNEDDHCSICLEYRRNVINVSCGHLSLCLTCCTKHKPRSCPMCQITISSWLVIS